MKRGRDGRFVAVYCHLCEDSGWVPCNTCRGSGIGMGPVESSRCVDCRGRGEVPCPGEEHEDGGLLDRRVGRRPPKEGKG
jgi:hypothetical protein